MTQRPISRLCLITPASVDLATFPAQLEAALRGGDVASLFITRSAGSPAADQTIAKTLVPIAQAKGVAAIIVGDTQLVGRSHADGIHIETGFADLEAAMAAFAGQRIVGVGALNSRDEAMEAGEYEPDYLFFGSLSGEEADMISPRALDLAAWWSELFVIPAIVMGGRLISSIGEAVAGGVEFVALRGAVWNHVGGAAAAVAEANQALMTARETLA